MCVVSMVGDFYGDKFAPYKPYVQENPYQVQPASQPIIINPPQISREEFEQLKRDVLDMKELLKRAKIYDEKNNEPNCELEEKMKLLRGVAKLVGVDLDDVLKKQPPPTT